MEVENTFERDALDGVLESFAPTQPDWEPPTPRVKKEHLYWLNWQ